MKVRENLVSNSSSSSFIVGTTGKKKKVTLQELYPDIDFEAVKNIYDNCKKLNIDLPLKIQAIMSNHKTLSPDSIVSAIDEEIKNTSQAILKWESDYIEIDVEKLPKEVKILKISFQSG